jgi:hypothetical protein
MILQSINCAMIKFSQGAVMPAFIARDLLRVKIIHCESEDMNHEQPTHSLKSPALPLGVPRSDGFLILSAGA